MVVAKAVIADRHDARSALKAVARVRTGPVSKKTPVEAAADMAAASTVVANTAAVAEATPVVNMVAASGLAANERISDRSFRTNAVDVWIVVKKAVLRKRIASELKSARV